VKEKLEALVAQLIDQGLLLDEALCEFEKKYILKVLEKSRGNQTKAAQVLGIHRNTLTKKLASYNHHKNH
jgi:Fis family transcriptional regulator, factor for inversion stimulation protein